MSIFAPRFHASNSVAIESNEGPIIYYIITAALPISWTDTIDTSLWAFTNSLKKFSVSPFD